MAYEKKSGGYHKDGGARREGTPTTFRDGQPVYHSDRNVKSGGNDSANRGGYKPRSNDGAKRDGYAPRSNDGAKRDGYAPRSNDGANRDGYKPRYNDGATNQGDKRYSKDGKPDYRKPEGDRREGSYGRGGAKYNNSDRGAKYEKNDRTNKFDKDAKFDKTARNTPSTAPAEREDASRDELPYLIIGRNAAREAIKSERSIDKILVSKEPDGSLREIINLARDRNIRVDEVERAKLDELCMPFGHGGKTGNHQGIVAQVPGVEYCELSDMLNAAKAKNEKPFIIVLDGIEDPHNLGSILRSAVCAGAHGVVIPKRRAVSVTAAASKASAGATEYCMVARVANLSGAIDRLKDEGMWIAGADMTGKPMNDVRMEGALVLVIGGESEGLSRLVREKCDFLVKIPMFGPLDSLNASVAAAVLMFEKRRQDGCAK